MGKKIKHRQQHAGRMPRNAFVQRAINRGGAGEHGDKRDKRSHKEEQWENDYQDDLDFAPTRPMTNNWVGDEGY